MYYPDELIEEIRMKNDIVDVISGYVRLQKKGGSYFGLCPFHNEKSPSFSVSPTKQMYYCFGCGAGGNVFTFLREYEHYSFIEAVQELARRAGVELPTVEYTEEMKQKESRRARLLEANKEAAKYFYYLLRKKEGETGLKYLHGRELSDETIHKFGLGFSSKYSDDLTKYLKGKGFPDDVLKEVGLSTIDEKMGIHDKFWNRVMFPIQDLNHRVIGFGGRVLGDAKPKYLNSPETPIFDKSKNLYGMNFARTSRAGNFILCEGYMDVISMHQAGFTQAVASLGTAFTSGQAYLLSKYTKDVILSYDSDEAGTKAALRAIGILKEAGMRGRVLNLEPYKDPDEFIKALGKDAFQKRLDEAENSFFFELKILERGYDLKDPERKTAFHREIARKICTFPEEVERENYIEAVAERYHIGFESLRSMVRTEAGRTGLVSEAVRPKSGIHKKPTREENEKKTQRMLITAIADKPALFKVASKYVSPSDFTVDLYRQVAERLFDDLAQDKWNPAAIVDLFEDEEEQREVASLFHTELLGPEDAADRAKAFKDILIGVKSASLEKSSASLGSDIQAITQAVAAKKALEELKKISIDTFNI